MSENNDKQIINNIFTALKKFKKFLLMIIILILIIYLATGIFTIKQNERGMIELFGKIIDDNISPGINYSLPRPFTIVKKIAVKEMKTLKLDNFASIESGSLTANSYHNLTGIKPYCLTGDNNILNVVINIKYNIIDPFLYVYEVNNADEIIRNICSNIIIKFIAQLSIDDILTLGKKRIEQEALLKINKNLTYIKSGISIAFLEVASIGPPTEVQESFNKLINAKIEKRKMINEAELYKNKRLPESRTKKQSIMQDAISFKKEKICKAEGDAAYFISLYNQYKNNKKTSKNKLYLEFLKMFLPNLKKVIIVDNNEKNSINLNLFQDD